MPSVAQARSSVDIPYPSEQAWNSVVRLIRVDFGFVITERDRESGFLMFTYRDTTRSSPGSVELVSTEVNGVPGVRVVVQVNAMPTYAERHLLTRLDRKLHEDYGEPRVRVRPEERPRERDRDGRPREGGEETPQPPASPPNSDSSNTRAPSSSDNAPR